MATPATHKPYQKLFKSIATIYDKAMLDVSTAVDGIFKEAYHEIGRLIVEVEQKGAAHAPYGEHLLENLSNDLTKSNRKGFSIRNLRNMRQVYLSFAIRQLAAELTWTHYVALSSIRDQNEREAYETKAIQKKWNVEELQQSLYKNQVKMLTLTALHKIPPKEKEPKIYRLAVKRGILSAYCIAEPFKDHQGRITPGLRVDLGFHIYHKISESEAKGLKPGNLIQAAKTNDDVDIKILPQTIAQPKTLLYTYEAELDKIIDGDTIKVFVKMGFRLQSTQKLRLRKINTPELDTKAGQIAKRFVEMTLNTCPFVIIKTYSTDIYDRYLVDIFYLPGCEDPARVAAEGIYLNQELIDKGLANLWQRAEPDELAFLN